MKKSLLEEIRSQPEHIRHIMMWLCVITSFSLVALVWFRSTQARFVAMLNPPERLEAPAADRFADRDLRKTEEERILAAKEENSPSPLASIRNSFGLLRASLGELLGSSQEEILRSGEGQTLKNPSLNQTKGFPLSGDK